MVHSAGGYDAGQKIKRRQRFMAVDTLGLVLPVLVTTANVGERFYYLTDFSNILSELLKKFALFVAIVVVIAP